MDWAVYGALIVGALATAGAAAYLVVQALNGWRTLKRLRRHLAKGLNDLADGAERTSVIVERISDQRALEQTLARLRRTLAEFAVLRQAIGEVDDSLRRVTAVYPRK